MSGDNPAVFPARMRYTVRNETAKEQIESTAPAKNTNEMYVSSECLNILRSMSGAGRNLTDAMALTRVECTAAARGERALGTLADRVRVRVRMRACALARGTG